MESKWLLGLLMKGLWRGPQGSGNSLEIEPFLKYGDFIRWSTRPFLLTTESRFSAANSVINAHFIITG